MAGKSARRNRAAGRGAKAQVASSQRTTWPWVIGGIAVAILAVALVWVMAMSGSTSTSDGTLVRANGGSYTNISADTLASRMETKDFTLLNVKTPYIGEIAGTDLYIPYTDLVARADELPADRSAPIVVYCRSGNESAIASQTLLDLGYTNIENLDGGMNAWAASGRSLIQLNRS
jgi:rhodanese-related sulfurtransferase